jgi:asparagine synthase (glutamine-hydrolysing)
MCGIVGSASANLEPETWVKNATHVLSHRGPDDSGWLRDSPISMGMSRLAIVDIKGGTQPFYSENKRFVIVFNGQIYNFKEIKTKLQALGAFFRSESDTEVILQGYIYLGIGILDILEGMFAFAIWDSKESKLVIARDKFGEKPLCFSKLPNGGLVFASEIKALLTHPEVSRNPDYESIQLMLNYGYVPSPKSAFSNIGKLPPAHYLVWQDRSFEMFRYWQPSVVETQERNEEVLLDKLETMLLESVSLRMNSDRGIGTWLSGGVDSSLVAYYMSRLQSESVETFSAGFKSQKFDETPFALSVSRHLKTSHNLLTLDGGIDERINAITRQLDEPFADSSFIPTFLLSEFTSKKRVVVLGGDGGDEAFGGYERYRFAKLSSNNASAPFSKLLSIGAHLIPESRLIPRKLLRIKEIIEKNPDSFTRYQSMMLWMDDKTVSSLLDDKFNFDLENFAAVNLRSNLVKDRKFEFSANLWDILSYLPGDLLPKVDMASMSFGLEVRSPFLDSSIMNFGLSLPDELRVTPTSQKYLLRKLALRHLPREIVERPKRGFGIPRNEWMNGQLRNQIRSSISKSNTNFAEIVNIGVAESLLSEFEMTGRNETDVWTLFMLANWANEWL